jgi:transcriptional/translational regulatory protein YebC/TACO1
VVVANIEEVQQKKKIVLSFAPSQFRMVAHSLRGQPYNFAVAPNVEWQPQTGVFVDDFLNCFLECHLGTFL